MLAAATRSFGRLDVLVNNAGVACVVGRWEGKAWAGRPRPTRFDPKLTDVVIELTRAR